MSAEIIQFIPRPNPRPNPNRDQAVYHTLEQMAAEILTGIPLTDALGDSTFYESSLGYIAPENDIA